MSESDKIGIHEFLENSWGGREWESYVNKFRNLSNIVIFGAGVWGKHLYHLFQHYHLAIVCFAVTNKEHNPASIEGIPVKSIEDLRNACEKVSVVVAISESDQSDVVKSLNKEGFENILCLDRQELWLSNIEVRNHRPEGKKFCPICEKELDVYLPFGAKIRYNAVCPWCGSNERHRAYWLYWKRCNYFTPNKIKMLHFAPERGLFERFVNMNNIDYYPVDIDVNRYGVKEKVDITDIPYLDNMFDIIICNHVLEHILDEQKALSELRRVLNLEGMAFLNVPVFQNYETTLEKDEYDTPELRLKYYGQGDHVRRYGRDYGERLRQAGFYVKEIEVNNIYSKEKLEEYGLQENERIYECKKI